VHVTGDQYLIKKINKSIVLDTIKNKSPLSRTQISELTGLNKGTVSSLVNELIAEDLAYEIGPGISSGGRKPVMLLFNRGAGFSIGIDLGVNYILGILTDLQGNIVREFKTLLVDKKFEKTVSQLIVLIRSLRDEAPPSRYGVVGIGIGVPGLVADSGFVLLAPNLGWQNENLAASLMGEFPLPILIDNEANAGALGEKLFGAGKQSAHLVYISVGMGIGAGLIINNELYRGFSGFSGELGHMIIETNGKKCSCGNRGCWELYASENSLLQSAKTIPGLDEEINMEYLVRAAEMGNPDAANLFSQMGEYLGLGLTNIINIFNPETIIIGNQVTTAEHWIHNSLTRVIESRALPFSRKKVNIKFASLGLRSTALGASFFAINHYFSNMKVTVE
jgi:predicted NBD/HSP70 family sugar kinase